MHKSIRLLYETSLHPQGTINQKVQSAFPVPVPAELFLTRCWRGAGSTMSSHCKATAVLGVRGTKSPCLPAEFHSVSSLPLSGCLWLLGQRLLCACARIFLPHLTVNISLSFLEEPYQTCPKTSQGICRLDPVSPCSAAGCTRGHVHARAEGCGCGQESWHSSHTCLRQAELRTPALNPPPWPIQAHHRF